MLKVGDIRAQLRVVTITYQPAKHWRLATWERSWEFWLLLTILMLKAGDLRTQLTFVTMTYQPDAEGRRPESAVGSCAVRRRRGSPSQYAAHPATPLKQLRPYLPLAPIGGCLISSAKSQRTSAFLYIYILFSQPPLPYLTYVIGGQGKTIYILFSQPLFPYLMHGKWGQGKTIYILFSQPPFIYLMYRIGGWKKSIIYTGGCTYCGARLT